MALHQFFEKYYSWFIAILTGFLLSLPWLAQELGFFIFIAFVPLFALVFNSKIVKRTYLQIFLCCVIWFTMSTLWLYNLHFDITDFLMLMPFIGWYGLSLSIPLVIARFITLRYGWVFGMVALPVLWYVMEFVGSHGDLSNTWVNLHYALCDYPKLIGFIYFTGFRYASPFILVVNAAVFLVLFKPQFSADKNYKYVISSLASVILLTIGVNIMWVYSDFADGKDATVAIVQPNFDPYETVDSKIAKSRFSTLSKLTIQARLHHPDLICWHETALRGSQLQADSLEGDTTISILADLSRQVNSPILLGTFLFKIYDYKPRNHTSAPTGDGRFYDVTNSALLINSRKEVSIYNKMKLVPFIERLPFISVFGGSSQGLFALGEQFPSYEMGKKRNLLSTSKLNVLPVICNESVYPSHVKDFEVDKADVIIIISNDGWAGSSSLMSLHANYARILAIENGKPVIRVTNNGISMAISRRGEIVKNTSFDATSLLMINLKYL